jgi:hypothetical protein
MLAVLEDAVACFQKHLFAQNRKKRMLFDEAEDWICNQNSEHVFSFDNICAALKFNPQYVREGLLRWKARKLAERTIIQLINNPSARHETAVKNNEARRMVTRVKEPDREKKVAGLR